MLGNETTVETRTLFKKRRDADLKKISLVYAGFTSSKLSPKFYAGKFIFPIIYFIGTNE